MEFKRDPRDGRFCLMEVNARHWKWHGLAARCGVNLSLAAYRDAIGDPYIARRQQDGVKWIVANKDVPLALLEIARRQRSAPEYLRSLRGTRMDGLPRGGRPAAGPAQRRDRGEADPDAGAAREGRRVNESRA